MKKHLTFARDVKTKVLEFNENHNLKIGVEQVMKKDGKVGYWYPVWFNSEKIYAGTTLEGANACINGIIAAYGCQISTDNSYIVTAPFKSVAEEIDFHKSEQEHSQQVIRELQAELCRLRNMGGEDRIDSLSREIAKLRGAICDAAEATGYRVERI